MEDSDKDECMIVQVIPPAIN
jgi:hypothetical protein